MSTKSEHRAGGLRVTKLNALIEACAPLSLNESRIISICLSQIDPRVSLDRRRAFRVHATEFQINFGIAREKAYTYLKEVAGCLLERRIEIRDPATGKVNDRIRWVSRCEYLRGHGAVQLYFSPAILPYISDIRAQFTSYSLSSVIRMSSIFAIRLYEILWQYRKFGKRVTTVGDIRRWLGCSETFDRFADFDRWVVRAAVNQINEHSDLRVAYRKIRQGRGVSHLEFSLRPIQPATSRSKSENREPSSSAETDRDWRAQMARYGWDPDANKPVPGGPLDK